MLRRISRCRPKQWDLALAQDEFSFNGCITGLLKKCLVVNTKVPSFKTDLTTLPIFNSIALTTATEIHKMLQEVQHLEFSNSKYTEMADKRRRAKSFSMGDLVIWQLNNVCVVSSFVTNLKWTQFPVMQFRV